MMHTICVLCNGSRTLLGNGGFLKYCYQCNGTGLIHKESPCELTEMKINNAFSKESHAIVQSKRINSAKKKILKDKA
jgi:hypothetical protein